LEGNDANLKELREKNESGDIFDEFNYIQDILNENLE
jgi:hypothetical protein